MSIDINELPIIAIDTETANNIPFIATTCDEQLKTKLYRPSNPEDLSELKAIAESPHIVKAFHSAVYDIYCLSLIGINVVPPIEDTLLMANYINEQWETKNLKRLAEILLGEETLEEHLLTKIRRKGEVIAKKEGIKFTWDMIPEEILLPYAMKDPYYTIKLVYYFYSPIKQYSDLYSFEKELVFVVVEMIQNGMTINREFVLRKIEECEAGIFSTLSLLQNYLLDKDFILLDEVKRKTLKGLYSACSKLGIVPDDSEIMQDPEDSFIVEYPIDFNPNSTYHVRKALKYLEIYTPPSGKKGDPATNADALKTVLKRGHEHSEFLEHHLYYKDLSKQNSTYYKPLYYDYTSNQDDTAHFLYYQSGARTGRFSANLIQTIPKATKGPMTSKSRDIRTAFIAPKGYKLLTIDYDQIEMRLFVCMSECEKMIQDINNGFDVHLGTAIGIYGLDKVNEDPTFYRRRAKNINFGIIYGMGTQALADQIGISLMEASFVLQDYYDNYPVKKFIRDTVGFLYKNQYIRIQYDSPRMRFIRDYRVPQRLAYKGVNVRIQGTAAYIMKFAMYRMFRFIIEEKLGLKLILCMHDELGYLIPNDICCLELYKKIIEVIEDRVTFKIPITATPKLGDDWGHCEEININQEK